MSIKKLKRYFQEKEDLLSPKQRQKVNTAAGRARREFIKFDSGIAKSAPAGKKVIKDRLRASALTLVGNDAKKVKRRKKR